MDAPLLIVQIEKMEIQHLLTQRLDDIMEGLKENGSLYREKVLMSVAGFDDVPEDLYEIPEVRRFMRKFLFRHPEVFYYLNDYMNVPGVILACICDVESLLMGEEQKSPIQHLREGRTISEIPKKRSALFMKEEDQKKLFDHLEQFGKKIGDESGVKETIHKLYQVLR